MSHIAHVHFMRLEVVKVDCMNALGVGFPGSDAYIDEFFRTMAKDLKGRLLAAKHALYCPHADG